MAKRAIRILCNHFEELTDPRVNGGGNHDLQEMIFMALTTCGAKILGGHQAICDRQVRLVCPVSDDERNSDVPELRQHTTLEHSHGRDERSVYYSIAASEQDLAVLKS